MPLSDQSDDVSVDMGKEKDICPSSSQTSCLDINRCEAEVGAEGSDIVTDEHCDGRGCNIFSLVPLRDRIPEI